MRMLQEISEQNPDDLIPCRFYPFQTRIRKLKFPILVSYYRTQPIPRNNPMRKILIAILLCTVLCAATISTSSLGQDKRSKSFLSNFQVGQIVLLSEPGGRYEFRIIKGLEVGHKVLEVGTDYVLLEDAGGVTEMMIPVTSIRSVVRLRE